MRAVGLNGSRTEEGKRGEKGHGLPLRKTGKVGGSKKLKSAQSSPEKEKKRDRSEEEIKNRSLKRRELTPKKRADRDVKPV